MKLSEKQCNFPEKRDMSFKTDKGHYVLSTINKQRPTAKHITLNYVDTGD